MADISMCDNPDCKDKDSCYRATAPCNPWRQSYIMVRDVLDKNSCEYYSPDLRTKTEIECARRWQQEAEAEYLSKNSNAKSN